MDEPTETRETNTLNTRTEQLGAMMFFLAECRGLWPKCSFRRRKVGRKFFWPTGTLMKKGILTRGWSRMALGGYLQPPESRPLGRDRVIGLFVWVKDWEVWVFLTLIFLAFPFFVTTPVPRRKRRQIDMNKSQFFLRWTGTYSCSWGLLSQHGFFVLQALPKVLTSPLATRVSVVRIIPYPKCPFLKKSGLSKIFTFRTFLPSPKSALFLKSSALDRKRVQRNCMLLLCV